MVAGTGDYAGFYDLAPTYSISSDGKTVSYTFTGLDTSTDYEPWGYVMEYVDYTGTTDSEAWLDYAPGTYAPWYTAGDDDTGDDDDDDTGDDDTGDDDDVTGDDDDDVTGDDDDEDDDKGIPGFETITIISAIGIALILLRRKK
jgi:hypothetical protein